MEHAVISFVSPKGYGMARLSKCGSLIFIPANLINQTELKMDDEISVRVEPGVTPRELRACAVSYQNGGIRKTEADLLQGPKARVEGYGDATVQPS